MLFRSNRNFNQNISIVPTLTLSDTLHHFSAWLLQSGVGSDEGDSCDVEREGAFQPMHKLSIRTEQTLGLKEKQLLIAVERGDMATMKAIMELAEV